MWSVCTVDSFVSPAIFLHNTHNHTHTLTVDISVSPSTVLHNTHNHTHTLTVDTSFSPSTVLHNTHNHTYTLTVDTSVSPRTYLHNNHTMLSHSLQTFLSPSAHPSTILMTTLAYIFYQSPFISILTFLTAVCTVMSRNKQVQ